MRTMPTRPGIGGSASFCGWNLQHLNPVYPQAHHLISGETMDLKLQGKRALVSGSTAGIGRAIAASLAR
jgi:hypothetical protein